MTDETTVSKRRYESPVREEQARRTRKHIVDAAVDVARERGSWDWRGITYKVVAERADVNERTVYRHFPNQQTLFQAIIDRLAEESNVSYAGMGLDDVGLVTEKVFRGMAAFGPTPGTSSNEVFSALDAERRQALLGALAGLETDDVVAQVAGVLDVLWSAESYQRLAGRWQLETSDAIRAVNWAIELLIDAVRDGRRPGGSRAAGRRSSG